MKSFSFIHTADLYLDSPFRGLRQVDGEIADLLKDATSTIYRSPFTASY
jgi:hypothetical protein